MDNIKKEKYYTTKEVAKQIKKSLYKCVMKNLAKKRAANRTEESHSDEIIADIEDANFIAEVDDSKIPQSKTNVLWKKRPAPGLQPEESEEEFQTRRNREKARRPRRIRKPRNVGRKKGGILKLRSFMQNKRRRKS